MAKLAMDTAENNVKKLSFISLHAFPNFELKAGQIKNRFDVNYYSCSLTHFFIFLIMYVRTVSINA